MVTTEVSSELAVAATVLGEKPFHFRTALHDWDSDNLTFLAPYHIVLEALLKLEAEDCLWMGHVTSCRAEGDSWRTTMRLEHKLKNLAELQKLAARFK